ncbi:MAG TPA: nuclear transport factor 2 family protein [Solirubrobacteraceae bacterium]|nr:nuclear transport factor 2 family protein [Solirubrobacteraceae bacterium]
MSPVEQVHALWSAFASRGPLASLDHVAEECEWIPSADLPHDRPVRGAAAMREYVERLDRQGVRIEPALHTCEQLGDDVLVGGRMRVVSRAALIDSPLFWLYRVRGGRVVRIESYVSRADALRAAA